MVFNDILNRTSVISASAPIHAFLKFFLTSTPHNILCSPLAAVPYDHMTIVEITDSGERRINPVAKTILNPLKENIGRAEDRTSDLLFSSLQRYRQSYRNLQHCQRKIMDGTLASKILLK